MIDYLKKNPLLAGCLGTMGCLALVAVFFFVAAGLGLKALVDSSQIAVFGATKTAAEEGFSFNYVFDNGDVRIDLVPFEPREVTCDQLWAMMEPHILKPDLPLVLRSQTAVSSEDGGMTVVPLECSRVPVDETAMEPPAEEPPAEEPPAEEPPAEEPPAQASPEEAADSPAP